MLSSKEIKTMIAQGEGSNLEFKQSLPAKASDLSHELCAFANSAGGTVLIGVTDQGNVAGIQLTNSDRSWLQQILDNLEPPLKIEQEEVIIEGKVVLCLKVPAGSNKPYLTNGSIYVRSGPNSQKITSREKISQLFFRSGCIVFEETPVQRFQYKRDFNEIFFNEFISIASISTALPTSVLQENLQLITEDRFFKSAGVLFFGNDPQRVFPHAVTRCLLFKGTSKVHILDDKTVSGNLYHQYQEALLYLQQKLNLTYHINDAGPRIEELEIPLVALREALVNALAHRDYSDPGATIMVEIYDDRVEISNPGGLVDSIERAQFGQKSQSRNPLIFGLLQRIRLVEKVGSGIRRMNDAMREAELPPPCYALEGMFTVTFFRPIGWSEWMSSLLQVLSAMQIRLIEILNANSKITAREVARQMNIDPRTVERNIAILKKRGIVVREGSDKDGIYRIVRMRIE
ncbi:MAG: ArsR family transcriptional regulator [Citrobacter freundii]|nr:MAG: ArsR family transcriptional regulator [Citrobacter freundii]